MARQGVFNREVTQLEQIKRSVQQLNHRHTTTLEEGVIIPNFSEYLYPNETLRLKTTNFLRTIPLKTPQLTRVRVVQRFVAFPLRLLWEYFPEYINALNPPASGIPDEPYIVNFNRLGKSEWQDHSGTHMFKRPSVFDLSDADDYFADTSACGIGQKSTSVTWSLCRLDFFKYYNDPAPKMLRSELDTFGYQFFPHELGDYLNAPLYTACLATDTSSRFSAYKFAAYQLAYSFFYRRPNIEEYIDDFFEMAQSGYSDQLFSEFSCFYANYTPNTPGLPGTFESPLSTFLAERGSSATVVTNRRKHANDINPPAFYTDVRSPDIPSLTRTEINLAKSTNFRRFCRWEDCEHFPLKAGANMVMQLKSVDSEGRISWTDSAISLTRLRYAPWFLDRFTSANPWPQRGSEALIPVTGDISVTLPDSTSVSFSGLTASIPSVPLNGTISVTNGEVWQGNNAAQVASESDSSSVLTLYGTANQSVRPLAVKASVPLASGSTTATTATISGSASASFDVSATNVQYALSVSPSNFRFYMQLQHMKEMSGMTDGRYKSFLSMFFGSHDQDFRLDRPEFIGGFVQDLDISEVVQTSETTDDSPLGALAGRAVSAKRGSRISYHAFEHALVMGFLHIVPDVEYIGGLNRQDNTTDPFDWVLPQFSGLSEQPIRMKELVCLPSRLDGDIQALNNAVFGYEPRYNERRARHSYVTGAFRDVLNSTGSYEYFKPWLVTRNFGFDVTEVTESTSGSVRYLKGLDYVVPTLSKEFVSTRHNLDYSNFDVVDPSFMKPFILDSFFEERLTAIIPRRGLPKL